jgi:hypothetical protein
MIPIALADIDGAFKRNGLSLTELRNAHSRLECLPIKTMHRRVRRRVKSRIPV